MTHLILLTVSQLEYAQYKRLYTNSRPALPNSIAQCRVACCRLPETTHTPPPPRSRLASRWLVDSLVKPGHVVTWQPPAASSWFSALVYSTVIHLVSCELFWSLCKPVTDNAFRNIRIHISQSSIPARFEEIHVGAWVHSTLQEKEWRQTQQTSPCPPLQGAAAPDIFSNMMPIPLPICRASFIAIAEITVFL